MRTHFAWRTHNASKEQCDDFSRRLDSALEAASESLGNAISVVQSTFTARAEQRLTEFCGHLYEQAMATFGRKKVRHDASSRSCMTPALRAMPGLGQTPQLPGEDAAGPRSLR